MYKSKLERKTQMLAVAHCTYRDYCAYNAARGLQVIPESLWNALKEEINDSSSVDTHC